MMSDVMSGAYTEADTLHPMTTETRIAVMQVQVGHIGDAVARIEASGAHAVPRTEWEQRNLYVDGRFADVHAKLVEANARKAPWWAIVASIAGVAATIGFLLEILRPITP